jgi:poly(hydroxyalkanoate) depolymerase family esterase
MNEALAAVMRRAIQSVRVQNVAEATRLIQGALAGQSSDEQSPMRDEASLAKLDGERAELSPELAEPAGGDGASQAAFKSRINYRSRRPLGELLQAIRKGRQEFQFPSPLPNIRPPRAPEFPQGARFLSRSYLCAAGTRNYKLYIPASTKDRPQGLIVMLHGCKQNPDDFALGTNMNAVAESHGLLVVYPAQSSTANAASCWNWFNPADQARDQGEPSIIAGITRELAGEFAIASGRIFVAGLSAGGAMAAVMGETYPDLYAAIGVHSGLACGSANDVVSAFAAMRGESIAPTEFRRPPKSVVRTIIFHGSADRTVAPSNAARIAARATENCPSAQSYEIDGSANGRSFSRSCVLGANGISTIERWLIEGAGHAWSGGRSDGSFTDASGPDASSEMVRFFLGDASSRAD